ncbi:type II toxin-antitoxin system VapC family toxin [Tateyamaria pelophila]|uniref:type II toxin-antitoxin system VapC family toxin n=1 Tax=Tateyamaria pelophila TaxID=328415 RepID=UPI001CBFCFC9
MILVDTSVWIDHLRNGSVDLTRLLNRGHVVCHPLVVAEIALGSLRARAQILGLLDDLPKVPIASTAEVRTLINSRKLFARGVGYVDVSLIASCLLLPGSTLWTSDKRLGVLADELNIRFVSAQN